MKRIFQIEAISKDHESKMKQKYEMDFSDYRT